MPFGFGLTVADNKPLPEICMTQIFVPTISENLMSYDRLFEIWRRVEGSGNRIVFDFSACTFLGQSGVAFLGGLARLVERRGGEIEFAWDTLRSGIRMNLAQNGFLSAFGQRVDPWEGNSIPIERIKS